MTFNPAHSRLSNGVYSGRVVHTRLVPFRHALVYRVFSILVDLNDVPKLALQSRVFQYNRFGLVSFYDKDHGNRDGSPLRPWIDRLLAQRGLHIDNGSVQALCFPRILGYVFNPLTLYYCRAENGALVAIIYEVKNTFGEQHAYVLPIERQDIDAQSAAAASGSLMKAAEQSVRKHFHVSPFFDVMGRYAFRVTEPGEKLGVNIRYKDAEGADLLIATHTARGVPFSDRHLIKALVKHPIQALKVIGGIHWEALKLWAKGAVFHKKPPAPQQEASW